MMEDTNEQLDGIYYPIDSRLGWVQNCLEDLIKKVDESVML